MSFTLSDYEDFCESVNHVNAVHDDVIEARKSLYEYASKELKAIFKKHMGLLPSKVHFSNYGEVIEVIYNLSDFNDAKLPLRKELIEDVHMPVKIKILDSSRLVFVLLPKVDGGE